MEGGSFEVTGGQTLPAFAMLCLPMQCYAYAMLFKEGFWPSGLPGMLPFHEQEEFDNVTFSPLNISFAQFY